VKKDASGLAGVEQLEDRVDDLYRTLRSQVFDYMIANPDQVVAAGWLLLAVHHVERIADHALNIAQRVEFMVTGERGARGLA
jgi:phosphate transport system protein